MNGCREFEKFPDLSRLESLREVRMCCCERVVEMKGVEELRWLGLLDISGCTMLINNLPELPHTQIVRHTMDWSSKRSRWINPEPGWAKLNSTEGGVIVRDSNGDWLWGLACLRPSQGSELRGISEGLMLAWQRGIRKIIVETDDLTTAEILRQPDSSYSIKDITSMRRCKDLIMGQDWEGCKVYHVSHMANLAARLLAEYGERRQSGDLLFDGAPPPSPDVQRQLVLDKTGIIPGQHIPG